MAGNSTAIFSLSSGSICCVLDTYLRIVVSSSCGDGSNLSRLECDSFKSRGIFLLIVAKVDLEDKYIDGVIFASCGFRGGVRLTLNEAMMIGTIEEI